MLDINGEIDYNTVIVQDFNTPLTTLHRSSRQKINEETVALSDTLHQMDLINIFRSFHPKAEYKIFSSAHEIFSRIDHMSGNKASLINFQKTEIISSIFSDHSYMKSIIRGKKTT